MTGPFIGAPCYLISPRLQLSEMISFLGIFRVVCECHENNNLVLNWFLYPWGL